MRPKTKQMIDMLCTFLRNSSGVVFCVYKHRKNKETHECLQKSERGDGDAEKQETGRTEICLPLIPTIIGAGQNGQGGGNPR